MNADFTKMFNEVEGRYLDDQESHELRQYASSLDRRLEAMRAVEAAEERIIADALAKVFAAYPDLRRTQPDLDEKATRDVTLVLRYCTLAMVRDDQQFLSDKLLYWLRTVLQAFFPRKLIDVTYRELARSAEANLDRAHLEYMAPYLRLTHSILTKDN